MKNKPEGADSGNVASTSLAEFSNRFFQSEGSPLLLLVLVDEEARDSVRTVVADLMATTRKGGRVLHIDGSRIADETSLFSCLREVIPHDGNFAWSNWPAIDELIHDYGIWGNPPRDVLFVWTDADQFFSANPEAFKTAYQILVTESRIANGTARGLSEAAGNFDSRVPNRKVSLLFTGLSNAFRESIADPDSFLFRMSDDNASEFPDLRTEVSMVRIVK